MTEEKKEEPELKQVTFVEKHPVPLHELLQSFNAMHKTETEYGHVYRNIVIDKQLTDHIKFNAVYAKIEIFTDDQKAHIWILDSDRKIADRVINNAFTVEEKK